MSTIRHCFLIGLLTALLGLAGRAVGQPTRPRATAPHSVTVEPPHLFINAFNYGDSIVLRWNVDRGAFWLAGNKRGYVLERIEYAGTQLAPVRKRVRLATIRPWSLDSMKQHLARNDRFVAIAAQILHGKLNTKPNKGAMAGFYQTYERQQGQFLTAAMAAEFSAGAATALGLRWVDRTINNNAARYEYRLWMNPGLKPRPTDLKDTATVVVSPRIVTALAAPQVVGVDAGDSVLTIKWLKQSNMGTYSGYYIERSTDGKTFKRLNDVPYVASKRDTATLESGEPLNPNEVTYLDSVRVNYRKLYYRIIGINSFADLSPVSKVIVGSGRDLTPPRPPIDIRKKVEDNRRIVLTWTLPKPAPDLKGFYIGQSNEYGGPYKPLMKTLLPSSARTFVNDKPVPYLGKYYVVAVVDTAGNTAFSYPVAALIDDKTPPAAPKRLTAKVDTNGIVTLRWPASTEPDALGYKLYRSYQRNNEYYQQRTCDILTDSAFVDTLPLRTLTRQAYYKLVAVDLSNNHSLFSEPIVVDIPDKVPPATPVIKNAVVLNSGIQLTLIPSLSEDVTKHTLYRREQGSGWQPIRTIPGNPQGIITHFDSTLTHQQTYEYSLIATDGGGRQSERSFVVTAHYVNLTKLNAPTPAQVRAVYDPGQKGIVLSWKTGDYDGPVQFMIYRGVNREGPLQYQLVDQANRFVDHDLPEAGTYTYAVQLIAPNRKSALSQPAQITYKP
ncbi:fibronectin type III domain-containing protein [Fibrella aquatilis]|uniref:Fibronectin type-III domain-containing protein n=1 Tax=Fibrella aquatilis TaxID=2817059 RepID=A0A939JVX8_9BACT|nr:hypothetical protein [Fibrella aquatilis]MBO0929424.1 hypothetical protein [Fibrella aquatilis]